MEMLCEVSFQENQAYLLMFCLHTFQFCKHNLG